MPMPASIIRTTMTTSSSTSENPRLGLRFIICVPSIRQQLQQILPVLDRLPVRDQDGDDGAGFRGGNRVEDAHRFDAADQLPYLQAVAGGEGRFGGAEGPD